MQQGAVRRLPAMAAALTVPSLWIAGSRDTVMEPRYVRHLAGYSREHRFALLEGEGHLPMCSAPAALAALIDEWLQQDLGISPGEGHEDRAADGAGPSAQLEADQSLAKPRS
jgi:hypothetical protein